LALMRRKVESACFVRVLYSRQGFPPVGTNHFNFI
jgi:hypothetical protein